MLSGPAASNPSSRCSAGKAWPSACFRHAGWRRFALTKTVSSMAGASCRVSCQVANRHSRAKAPHPNPGVRMAVCALHGVREGRIQHELPLAGSYSHRPGTATCTRTNCNPASAGRYRNFRSFQRSFESYYTGITLRQAQYYCLVSKTILP